MSSAILAALGGAAGSGLLAADAVAQVVRREDDDDRSPPLLVARSGQGAPILLAGHRSHRSHSSHSSHRSHYSSRGGGYSGGGGYSSGGSYSSGDDSTATYTPPPPPPKPARVSFVAFPGGRIFIDDKPIGRDVTGMMILKPGSYVIRIENRFLGNHSKRIELTDGQTGQIEISW